MRDAEDMQSAWRTRFLTPVARLCVQAGVDVTIGECTPGHRPASQPVRAMLCAAPDGSWDVAVTVVRARRGRRGLEAHPHAFARNPETGYDLATAGEIVYEVRIREDDDGAGGHGPRPLVEYTLLAEARAAADTVLLWVRRAALFHADPPTSEPRRQRANARRRIQRREAAAAAPDVTIEAAADLAVHLDPAALCWNFPREHRTGRYLRSAVVALTCEPGLRPHQRGSWLTVRVRGEGLAVRDDELIGANQRHRWDLTPWLWDSRHLSAPAGTRWQTPRPERVAAILDAVDRGALPEALRRAGVHTDEHITRLLAGAPDRLARAQLTETWVAHLYDGLADAAPWRFGAAYESWLESRRSVGLKDSRPVVLFGLGGVGASRKPKLALAATPDGPVLRLVHTGGNAVLPRSLWTIPDDLRATLHPEL